VRGSDPPAIANTDLVIAVRHHGELLGALAIANPPGSPVGETEARLVGDLAAQAGLVLRNARLVAELAASVAELAAQTDRLAASRHRVVAAHDDERREIERNIHDGAQQHLVALAVRIGLARERTSTDPAAAREAAAELRCAAEAAAQTLHDLARETYPPVLTERGLLAALDAHVRAAGVSVTVRAEGVGRYHTSIESAMYFCCLEALQNATKYGLPPIGVELLDNGSTLELHVRDAGGFDVQSAAHGAGVENMSDRIGSVGGTVGIDSAAGKGTTVTARVPLPSRELTSPGRPRPAQEAVRK
jgi:signal transduction histidine kinase